MAMFVAPEGLSIRALAKALRVSLRTTFKRKRGRPAFEVPSLTSDGAHAIDRSQISTNQRAQTQKVKKFGRPPRYSPDLIARVVNEVATARLGGLSLTYNDSFIGGAFKRAAQRTGVTAENAHYIWRKYRKEFL